MLSIATDDELQSFFRDHSCEFLYTCGYTKATYQIKVKDVDQLIKCVWLHFVKFQPHVELEQLRRGLRNTLGMDALLTTHPECVWGMLVASDMFEITPDYLIESFVIIYSENGSNNRTKEEAVVFLLFDYISDCKGIDTCTCISKIFTQISNFSCFCTCR